MLNNEQYKKKKPQLSLQLFFLVSLAKMNLFEFKEVKKQKRKFKIIYYFNGMFRFSKRKIKSGQNDSIIILTALIASSAIKSASWAAQV